MLQVVCITRRRPFRTLHCSAGEASEDEIGRAASSALLVALLVGSIESALLLAALVRPSWHHGNAGSPILTGFRRFRRASATGFWCILWLRFQQNTLWRSFWEGTHQQRKTPTQVWGLTVWGAPEGSPLHAAAAAYLTWRALGAPTYALLLACQVLKAAVTVGHAGSAACSRASLLLHVCTMPRRRRLLVTERLPVGR